ELKMTIGIILLGSLLFLLYRYWKGIYRLFPEEFSLDALYNYTLSGLEKGSSKVTKGYMTGYLRDYLVYIYLFFVTAIGGVLIYTGAFFFDISHDSPITDYEWILDRKSTRMNSS